jgi:hypothetical protein
MKRPMNYPGYFRQNRERSALFPPNIRHNRSENAKITPAARNPSAL